MRAAQKLFSHQSTMSARPGQEHLMGLGVLRDFVVEYRPRTAINYRALVMKGRGPVAADSGQSEAKYAVYSYLHLFLFAAAPNRENAPLVNAIYSISRFHQTFDAG